MADRVKGENVFLFVPNVIGYIRVILAIGALYYMPLHPRRCSVLYSISCLLDALDGYAARIFNQSTRFGAVLDMVTDRCTTTCLLVFLAIARPAWALLFQALISLDLASHYMHMYATLAVGIKGESHKSVSAAQSRVLNLYYKKWVLFICCAGNELFFLGLYLLCFSSPDVSIPLLPTQPSDIRAPEPLLIFPFESSAAAMEVARANKISDVVPWMLTLLSSPIMLIKQYVNIEQLINASWRLAEGDREERSKLQKSN